MNAMLSDYALEAIGFRDRINRGSITASFMSVTVYEARGIKLPDGFAEARQSRVAGCNYRIALSNSVNAASQCLLGDDFIESESEWLKEVKVNGPFVLIAVGPTDFIECEAGVMMRSPDSSITTYDSFPTLRQTLKLLEERVLPPVVATLTLALNESDRYVVLRKISRASVGRTTDGITIHDICIDVNAEMTVSRLLEEARASEVLNALVERAPKLDQRAAKYFFLGTAESDQLKKVSLLFPST